MKQLFFRLGSCAVFVLLLASVGGCEDDSGKKTDLGSQGDGPAAGIDGVVGADKGQGKNDKAVADSTASSDQTGSPDLTSQDSEVQSDQGACKQDGQPCGGAKGKCCSGLTCCTGTPVPAGKEYCAATCPKSDRNVKYGFKSTSAKKILQQLTRLPISTWTYKNEPPTVRHIGPMAQDFKAVFGVGANERFISPLDAAGVSLLSIQELNRQVEELGRQMKALRKENRDLRRMFRASRTR